MQEKAKRRCCGLDVHQQTVWARVLTPEGDQPVRKVFGTFRNDVIRLRVWLKQLKVTDIARESTGVYWRPIWNLLEGHGFSLLLVNRSLERLSWKAREKQSLAHGLRGSITAAAPSAEPTAVSALLPPPVSSHARTV